LITGVAQGTLDIRLGAVARRHIEERGLTPADVACIPAAAGGPKGLALLPFDRWLAASWLARMPRVELVGASIGAWRMAALARPDAADALDRLQHAYVREQNYPQRPSPAMVAATCRRLAQAVCATPVAQRPAVALSVISARARAPLAAGTRMAFARAAFANVLARSRLAQHLQRVVFGAGAVSALRYEDAFGDQQVPLTAANREDALLASGSIPLVCEPVRDIDGAPPGDYWDGGLIDYHLLLPYARLPGLTLYPHFVPWVTPGWLDKSLRWRARPRAHPWLASVVLIAPSPAMLARLPNGRLPERQDFYRYGLNHAARIAAWERAIAEMQRFADDAAAWLERPDLSIARPL
jgi:hypothetical protein